MPFRVIIFGGRDFSDYTRLETECDRLLVNKHPDVEVVGGACDGTDKLAKRYAIARGYGYREFPADWERFGKRAGFLRNSEMGDYGHAGISFWDGQSVGTKMMLDICQRKGLPVKIIRYEPAPFTKPERKQAAPAPKLPRNAVEIDGEVLIPKTKKKRKPASSGQKDFRHAYKDIFEAAHKLWFAAKYPNAWKDGHYTPSRCPDVTTANGMASYIVDHCEWTGNYANRINVMGRQIGGKHITSSTKKGTPDVDILINAIPIKAEIKIGKDALSEAQIKQQAAITKAGGLYYIFKSIDDYLDIFFQYSVKQRSIF